MSDVYTPGLPADPTPEPTTPMWLPALGALFFIGAGVAWALSPPAAALMETDATDASVEASGLAATLVDAGAAPAADPAATAVHPQPSLPVATASAAPAPSSQPAPPKHGARPPKKR